jgi:hypothetical protein
MHAPVPHWYSGVRRSWRHRAANGAAALGRHVEWRGVHHCFRPGRLQLREHNDPAGVIRDRPIAIERGRGDRRGIKSEP